MNSKKCDRCGDYYMPYYASSKKRKGDFNGFRLMEEDANFNLHVAGYFDLCQTCALSLKDWYRNVDEEKDAKLIDLNSHIDDKDPDKVIFREYK